MQIKNLDELSQEFNYSPARIKIEGEKLIRCLQDTYGDVEKRAREKLSRYTQESLGSTEEWIRKEYSEAKKEQVEALAQITILKYFLHIE